MAPDLPASRLGAPASEAPPALEVRELGVHFGGHVAVDRVSCAFRSGSLTAIVGPNGAGKTTLFNLISGQLAADSGRVFLAGEDITRLDAARRARRGLGRAFQQTQLFPGLSVLENVRLAVASRRGVGPVFWRTTARMHGLHERTQVCLEQVGLTARGPHHVRALSHGEQRKLEFALLLALEPQVLLLDEPTAGMGIEEVPMILDLIASLKRQAHRAILLIEHRMDVVHALADRLVVLHEGRLIADGAPAEVSALAQVRDAYLGPAGGPDAGSGKGDS